MSEETTSHQPLGAADRGAPAGPATFQPWKLALALGFCAIAAAALYKSSTGLNKKFDDPVANQAAADAADPVVDTKDKMEGQVRIRTATHKSGKVEVFREDFSVSSPPVSGPTGPAKGAGKGGPSGKGKGAPGSKKGGPGAPPAEEKGTEPPKTADDSPK